MSTTPVCTACQHRVKTWKGDDPKCGFQQGQFDGLNNWNCATVGKIRELVNREDDSRIGQGGDDQRYAVVSLLNFDVLPEEDDEGCMNAQPVCLYVSWYKDRGRTEAMWLMFEYQPPRPPTEEECLKIITHYAAKHSL